MKTKSFSRLNGPEVTYYNNGFFLPGWPGEDTNSSWKDTNRFGLQISLEAQVKVLNQIVILKMILK